jgi:hypothetical protein
MGMSRQATGTFNIESWEDTPYDEKAGAKLSRTQVTKTFQGEVQGTSTAELLMAGAQEGSAAYVGLERVTGSVHGQNGSFVLMHFATMTRGEGVLVLSVVPDSGTDDLLGLTGEAKIELTPDGGHNFTLDYEL